MNTEQSQTKFDGGPAFPGKLEQYPNQTTADGVRVATFPGMSLREYAAVRALHGLLSNSNVYFETHEEVAADAVNFADALLQQLAGNVEPENTTEEVHETIEGPFERFMNWLGKGI